MIKMEFEEITIIVFFIIWFLIYLFLKAKGVI